MYLSSSVPLRALVLEVPLEIVVDAVAAATPHPHVPAVSQLDDGISFEAMVEHAVGKELGDEVVLHGLEVVFVVQAGHVDVVDHMGHAFPILPHQVFANGVVATVDFIVNPAHHLGAFDVGHIRPPSIYLIWLTCSWTLPQPAPHGGD